MKESVKRSAAQLRQGAFATPARSAPPPNSQASRPSSSTMRGGSALACGEGRRYSPAQQGREEGQAEGAQRGEQAEFAGIYRRKGRKPVRRGRSSTRPGACSRAVFPIPTQQVQAQVFEGLIGVTGVLVREEEDAPERDAREDGQVRPGQADDLLHALPGGSLQDEPPQRQAEEFQEVEILHRQQVDEREQDGGDMPQPVARLNRPHAEVEREQQGVQDDVEVGVHQGDEVLPQARVDYEERSAPQREARMGNTRASSFQTSRPLTQRSRIMRICQTQGCGPMSGRVALVNHPPKRAAGGEGAGERCRAETVVNPRPGGFVPVKAAFPEERRVGEQGEGEQEEWKEEG